MKIKQYLTEGKRKQPIEWVKDYMENMFDSGDAERYKTWKQFFQTAKNGAYDWSEVIYSHAKEYGFKDMNDGAINKMRDKILTLKDTKFKDDKKLFISFL